MRRLLSLVVALVLVMGTVSVFAASADWNGYFHAKYRYMTEEAKGATDSTKDVTTYFWQKLELYPSWTLSDNVKLNAGFFTQNYWGSGRMYGFYSGTSITPDSGSFVGDYDMNPVDYTVDAKGRQKYNVTLGVSAAWATLTFMEGKLGIDIGRRRNAEWGTGAFFGGDFNPDRIFITYKTPGMGGLMLPYFIYEARDWGKNDYVSSDDDAVDSKSDAMHQVLFGLIYLAPGKTLAGLTINPNFVGEGYTYGANAPTADAKSAIFWAFDLYIEHKVKVNDQITVKPIFEVVYAFGTADEGTGLTKSFQAMGVGVLYPNMKKISVDVLNAILKVEVAVKDMVTLTPEFGFHKTTKEGSKNELVYNFWATNEFCGSEYAIGNIFNGVRGGSSTVMTSGWLGKEIKQDKPGWWYVKVKADADILGTIIPGLNAYAAFIMAYANDKTVNLYLTGDGTAPAHYNQGTFKDKDIVTEVDLGVSYAINSTATISFDFGYAKWGKSPLVSEVKSEQTAGAIERTDVYYGADLVIKF